MIEVDIQTVLATTPFQLKDFSNINETAVQKENKCSQSLTSYTVLYGCCTDELAQ